MDILNSPMNKTRALSAVLLSVGLVVMAGCDQKTPPPPSASSGQGINNLASNPQSILGKSAAMGKNAAAGIERQQDAAANAANQITGQSGSEVVVGGLKFAIPDGWKQGAPSSSMVQSTYTIPAAGSAQCNFSTAGGDLQSNIDRWRSQITDESGKPVQGDVTTEQVAGFQVTIFKATGTYAAMGGHKMPNTAFRAAVIKMPAESVFVRLTAPADQVDAVDGPWDQMIRGASR
jgi:hypothetical protein